MGMMRGVVGRVGRLVRRGGFAALDRLDRWRGRADDLTPPRRLQQFVGGGFQTVGREFLAHLRQLCRLQPQESVLDIGCGVGRIAVPLLDYLGPQGSYLGFDISRDAVEWCAAHITPRTRDSPFIAATLPIGSTTLAVPARPRSIASPAGMRASTLCWRLPFSRTCFPATCGTI